MANTSIEVKKSATPATHRVGDVWQSMRQEMEQLFDRFSNFDLVPLARGIEHFWPRGGMLSVSVDMSEDDKAYTVTAELPGIRASTERTSMWKSPMMC